jgi:hypothetical protein
LPAGGAIGGNFAVAVAGATLTEDEVEVDVGEPPAVSEEEEQAVDGRSTFK